MSRALPYCIRVFQNLRQVNIMKYTEKNPPLACLLTQSPCYKGTGRIKPTAICWHDTGCNNTVIRRYVQPSDDDPNREKLLSLLSRNPYSNDWNHTTRRVGVHFFIGKLADGTVTSIQTLPLDNRAWGTSSGKKGSANNVALQFEICRDDMKSQEYFEKAYREAVELTAYLCKIFSIDPHGNTVCNGVTVPTIFCHADAHRYGLGNNHSDVTEWFPKFGKSMATVREDVAKLLAESSDATPRAIETPSPTEEEMKQDSNEKAQGENDVTNETYTGDVMTEKRIWEKLFSFIPNPYSVAGIMGNLMAESGLNPQNLQSKGNRDLDMTDEQYTTAVDDGSYTDFTTDRLGFGLAQWTYPSRKEAFLAFAKERGTSIGDLETQLYFLCQEMNGYKTVMDVLRSATSVREASDVVLTKYEKPADQSEAAKEKRSKYGEQFYDRFAEKPTFPYLVRITDTHLNIRKGPAKTYASRGYIKPGTYTIVDEKDGYGLLLAYAAERNGWVMLKYTTRKK